MYFQLLYTAFLIPAKNPKILINLVQGKAAESYKTVANGNADKSQA